MEFYSDFHIVGKVVFFGRWRFVKKRKKGKKSEKTTQKWSSYEI